MINQDVYKFKQKPFNMHVAIKKHSEKTAKESATLRLSILLLKRKPNKQDRRKHQNSRTKHFHSNLVEKSSSIFKILENKKLENFSIFLLSFLINKTIKEWNNKGMEQYILLKLTL